MIPTDRPPPGPSGDPDLELVRSAQAGDPDAFDIIVVKYQQLVAALLHRFARNSFDLEDLVQETFVKAWQALPRWQPESPFSHWLKRIAVRTGLEDCRRRKTSPITAAISLADAGPLAADGGEKDDAHRAFDEVHHILSELLPEDQAVLTLTYLHGMTMEEIASHFQWSRANAKIKAFRARHRLRKILARHGYTFE